MLLPKKTKYSKNFARRRLNLKVKEKISTFAGFYSIFLIDSGKITNHQIEALRKSLRRHLRKDAKIWLKVFPSNMATQQAKQTRMGKGKGSIDAWYVRVNPGKILFEVDGLQPLSIITALNAAKNKLPVSTKVRHYPFKT